MDYSKYYEFPFPSILSEKETELKRQFLSLSDEEQLRLLNGSKSYEDFCAQIEKKRNA